MPQGDVTTHHPQYDEFSPDWIKMRDTYRGERRVKSKNYEYLPATPGQIADGLQGAKSQGFLNYQAYKTRARFPDFVAQAVEALIGVMHHKPPTIELPPQLEQLREKATVKGEGLEILLRRINEAQLVTGRVGLLADVPEDSPSNVTPYIAIYTAETIINWDDGRREDPVLQSLNLVVLNESEFERTDIFNWEQEDKYRVLLLGDPEENEAEGKGIYRMGLFGEDETSLNFTKEKLIEPSIAGATLDEIPFVFINSKDVISDPDDPPLLGLANLALTVYRSEADYRQSLFMQSQDTLVIIGALLGEETEEGEPVRTGAGAKLQVQQGGDAKYIGVESKGLEEQRMAIENDKKEAADIGGKLLDTTGNEAESGNALRIRVSARTASLNQIARAGAEGLQTMLRIMARWVGADPEAVTVQPNLDFADDSLEGRTLVEWMTAKTLGLPLSKESIHRKLQEKDLTELDFEEEMGKLEEEAEDEMSRGLDGGGDGTGAGGNPEDDPEENNNE